MLGSLLHMTIEEDIFGEVLTNNFAELLLKEHPSGLFTIGKFSFLSVKFKPQMHGEMAPSSTVISALP